MNFLLDTCVLSEFVKPKPSENVLNWMYNLPLESIFLSSLTVGELWKGIVRLQISKRRDDLEKWFDLEILEKYSDRILPITKEITMLWGEQKSELETKGIVISVIDSLISATASYYKMTVATRNIKDFLNTGCKLYNPWD